MLKKIKGVIVSVTFATAFIVVTLPAQPAQACTIMCNSNFWGNVAIDACLSGYWGTAWTCEYAGAYIGGL